ncbi:MAG: hypothetical protein JSW58_08220 [Candidatus Latescibacterota bacterium]|nr:MAG: hypothetical protein JSW58_08220 [Candidatus Latescibacterota bacterium]
MEFFGPFIEDFGMEVIPNLITANDELHVPLDDEKRSTHVVFAPSTVNPNAPNPKGVEEVKRACKAYGLTLDVVFRKSFEECMMRKQRAMVGVDEVITGMYHRSGLEFLSQGVPCFTALNEFGETALKKATGADWVPFEKTTPKELGRDMRALLHDGDLRRGQGRKARQWIETYYAPQVLIERHLEVYKR